MKETVVSKKKKASESQKSLSLPVFDLSGSQVATVDVSPEMFGQPEHKALIAQYIRVYRANQRQGNASAKTRAEVAGTTKKVYRQKGTGRARHGSDKSNLFRGGGATFGPLVRDINLSMNKKQKRSALISALGMKYRSGGMRILNAETLGDKPATKIVASALKTMGAHTGRKLFVLTQVTDSAFVQSVRNIEDVTVVPAQNLNAYEVLNTQNIFFVDDAVTTCQNHFLSS